MDRYVPGRTMTGALLKFIIACSTDGACWSKPCFGCPIFDARMRALALLLMAALFSEVEKRARPMAITGEVAVAEGARAPRKPNFVAASIFDVSFLPFPNGRSWLRS